MIERLIGRSWNYLILGGGTAGCVLAARLSEDRNVSVALIEAGDDLTLDNAPAEVLSNFPGRAYFNPAYTWPHLRVALGETGANAPDGRVQTGYEQARILGGGSSINGLIANRGAPGDYDEWEQQGAEGWNFANILPYFRKLERDLDFDDDYHGRHGPIAIRRFPRADWSGFTSSVARALENRGFVFVPDQNGRWQDGVMQVPASVDEQGRRSSCAFGYLTTEVRARDNLVIVTKTMVEQVLFDGVRATGARIACGGRRETVRAREVILSCGTVHSPAMLMRSGVGPQDELYRHGITPVAIRAGVGQNLQEHPVVSISCFLSPAGRMRDLERHHTQAHLRFSSGQSGCPSGDMCLAIISRSGWHAMGQRVGSLYFWVNKSYSRGVVRLRSARPDDEPEVDFRMLGDWRDLKRLREAFRFVADLATDPELDGVRSVIFPANYSERVRKVSRPGFRNQVLMATFATMLDVLSPMQRWLIETFVTDGRNLREIMADDATLDDYLKRCVVGVWHPVGTCRMGAPRDRLAVTDPSGKVLGTEGLRICDASLMPTIISANTNITTIMIAERVADLIKSEQARRTASSSLTREVSEAAPREGCGPAA